MDLLQTKDYRKLYRPELCLVDPGFLEDKHLKQVREIVSEVTKIETFNVSDSAWNNNLANQSGLVSKLQGTVKTHKDPDKVVMQPIQSTAGFPFLGLEAWVNKILPHSLGKFDHIVRFREQNSQTSVS